MPGGRPANGTPSNTLSPNAANWAQSGCAPTLRQDRGGGRIPRRSRSHYPTNDRGRSPDRISEWRPTSARRPERTRRRYEALRRCGVSMTGRVVKCAIPAQLRRRRAASHRLPPLACGARDPWRRCHDNPRPGEREVDGYRDAVLHLDADGLLAAPRLAELGAMWRRGGADQRLAVHIAERWELST